VCDGLQDRAERLEADGNVKKVSSIEEVVEVSQQREAEVPGNVQERLHRNNDASYFLFI